LTRSLAGDYVVLAAEPLCVCGVDVAAPGQLRRRGAQQTPMCEHVQQFKRQFTAPEVAHILSAGSEGARHACAAAPVGGRRASAGQHEVAAERMPPPACALYDLGAQQSAFQRIWSLKEALVKARGDGLAYELGRAEFTVHEDGAASVLLDSAPQRHWCGSLAGVRTRWRLY
jgi:4'-phosphopantetheinyl transferase